MAIQLESITTLIGTQGPEAVPGSGREVEAEQKTLLTLENSFKKNIFENGRSI